MNDRIKEIESFLHHKDFSLARRRMLDLALDAANDDIIVSAIEWSRTFNNVDLSDASFENEFVEQAHLLLNRLQQNNAGWNSKEETLISVDQVSKSFAGGRFVLHPISLEVKTGDVIGVVGENGNGKTTLLRSLSGQLAIDSGTIHYKTLSDPDHYSIKQHLAFIPQRIPRWYGQLKDNLHFSASLTGLKGRKNEIMVDYMLERMNLADYAHLNWNQVSSGYRTRFEIARVLLQRPKLMLLDEPLANLDILAQQTILTDLRFMAKSVRHPMGVLLSSQQLHEVEKIADTVLFIKQGKCLYRTGGKEAIVKHVLEIETAAQREMLAGIFENEDVQIHFNGGNYTLSSTVLGVDAMLKKMLAENISISYFRDITHSTKRFF